MSTLKAARADNMYYPPEWRPEYGGISKFQGSNGHNQYEKYGKIRFELPVHGWCLGCGRHIGRVSCPSVVQSRILANPLRYSYLLLLLHLVPTLMRWWWYVCT